MTATIKAVDVLTMVGSERRIELGLFDSRWRMNHFEGRVDLDAMQQELEQISRMPRAALAGGKA